MAGGHLGNHAPFWLRLDGLAGQAGQQGDEGLGRVGRRTQHLQLRRAIGLPAEEHGLAQDLRHGFQRERFAVAGDGAIEEEAEEPGRGRGVAGQRRRIKGKRNHLPVAQQGLVQRFGVANRPGEFEYIDLVAQRVGR